MGGGGYRGFLKHPELLPLYVVVGGACALVGVQAYRMFGYATDVSVTKEHRKSLFREDAEHGEKYRFHSVRRFFKNFETDYFFKDDKKQE